LIEEEQQLDHGYEQSNDIDSNRIVEEQHSVGDEPSIHEITLHANSDCQSMELDESTEVEEEQQQHQLEQNDDETGGQLEDEQRLKQERLEDKQQLEQERKLGRRRMIVIEAYERDLRALGDPVPMPKGRRKKRRRTTD
jgi:antirestriction protein